MHTLAHVLHPPSSGPACLLLPRPPLKVGLPGQRRRRRPDTGEWHGGEGGEREERPTPATASERRAKQLVPVHSTTPVDCCPDGWVGYRRKCYYFAKSERNWISSKRNCSSFSASLAVVDSQDEMDFLLRYKTSADHWIGLERELETEPWKWVNGTIFNKWFQIRGGGQCAYINDQGAASSSCTREEPWICSKSVNR